MKNKLFYNVLIAALVLIAVIALLTIFTNINFNNRVFENKIIIEESDSLQKYLEENGLASTEAQFEPSPVIEGFVLLNHRGKNFQLDLNQPAKDSIFHFKNGGNNIPFSGIFPNIEENFGLRIKIFSNDESLFGDDQPLKNIAVFTEYNLEGQPRFDILVKNDFSPGLYYYVLETIVDEQLILGGKFKIVR